jgi:predicted TIM-barrel fold metal-dependent hydrolase
MLIGRFQALSQAPGAREQLPNGLMYELNRFYYDVAQSSNVAAMSALAKVVPTSQIVFGTDFPYTSAVDHVEGLAKCGVFSAEQLRALGRENALPLVPRLKGA